MPTIVVIFISILSIVVTKRLNKMGLTSFSIIYIIISSMIGTSMSVLQIIFEVVLFKNLKRQAPEGLNLQKNESVDS